MNTKLFLNGELHSIKTTEFKGEKVSKLQFLNENEENGGLEIIEVKINPEHNNTEIKKGDKLLVPILMTSMEKKIYYRTSGKIQIQK